MAGLAVAGTTPGNDVESVFDTSVLFAMLVYAIVAIAIHLLISWLNSRMARLDEETSEYHRRVHAERLAESLLESIGASPEPIGELTDQGSTPTPE